MVDQREKREIINEKFCFEKFEKNLSAETTEENLTRNGRVYSKRNLAQ